MNGAERARKWREKKKRDPEWVERERIRQREDKRHELWKDPEKVRARHNAYVRRRKVEDPEWGEARNRRTHERAKERASEDPDRAYYMWRRKLMRSYGMTPEDYDQMLERQGGVCALCGSAEPDFSRSVKRLDGSVRRVQRFSVDHCHETGTVRGLLCMRCNSGIGYLNDDPELLLKAVLYLEKDERNCNAA